uniref:Uncharacterized protein n=1 Tax=Anguilla anguilla TaxID=7936 RepID=A0A0E9PF42_ANGAN
MRIIHFLSNPKGYTMTCTSSHNLLSGLLRHLAGWVTGLCG